MPCPCTPPLGPPSCPPGHFGTPPACSCVEDNTAYFGNNARVGSSNPQPSRAACARSCREHPECEFWTWGKGEPMGPCYLKHSRDNVSPGLPSYVSGSKHCRLEEQGRSLPGRILAIQEMVGVAVSPARFPNPSTIVVGILKHPSLHFLWSLL